jgi:hypothetical protein
MNDHDRRDSDPRGYLDTPARIIAENDKFVVVAVRVEKACCLRSNMHFLAALADVTG